MLQIFGGIKQHGKQGGFFIVVEKHDTATLLPIIKKYIAPGSIIMSDCWKAYDWSRMGTDTVMSTTGRTSKTW